MVWDGWKTSDFHGPVLTTRSNLYSVVSPHPIPQLSAGAGSQSDETSALPPLLTFIVDEILLRYTTDNE